MSLDMTWLVLIVVVVVLPSFAISWIASRWVQRWGPRWGLIDWPGTRKVHTTPTPTAGGLAIWAGIVIPLAVWLLAFEIGEPWLISDKFWITLAGGSVLMVLGLIDDRRGLNWRLRLGIQSLVALAMVLYCPLLTAHCPLIGTLSVLWIVGLINSFNMLDNMDGLSAGVAAIVGTILALLVFSTQPFLGGFLLMLVGSLIGFLWHNRPPARLFMGDTGSYFIGYLLAITSLATMSLDNRPRHAVFAPLCIFAIPLYDTASVIFIRLRAGRSPFEGDKCHFSHRLVDLGMSKTQAVLLIYLLTAITGLGAFGLYKLTICVLATIAILEIVGRLKLRKKN